MKSSYTVTDLPLSIESLKNVELSYDGQYRALVAQAQAHKDDSLGRPLELVLSVLPNIEGIIDDLKKLGKLEKEAITRRELEDCLAKARMASDTALEQAIRDEKPIFLQAQYDAAKIAMNVVFNNTYASGQRQIVPTRKHRRLARSTPPVEQAP